MRHTLEISKPRTGEGRVCAIHQPNFFPWLGYFDKMQRADVFVYLDAVSYPRSGSRGWSGRVKIAMQNEARWIGCPIQHGSRSGLIHDVVIADDWSWRGKFWRALDVNYRKAPNFAQTMAMLEPLIFYETNNLADFNINAIERIRKFIGIGVETLRQSELRTTGASTELLIDITRLVECDTYLCGGGAAEYQEDALFEPAGIRLAYQDFSPKPYGDSDKFIPGLSVIDYLMKTDVEALAPNEE